MLIFRPHLNLEKTVDNCELFLNMDADRLLIIFNTIDGTSLLIGMVVVSCDIFLCRKNYISGMAKEYSVPLLNSVRLNPTISKQNCSNHFCLNAKLAFWVFSITNVYNLLALALLWFLWFVFVRLWICDWADFLSSSGSSKQSAQTLLTTWLKWAWNRLKMAAL